MQVRVIIVFFVTVIVGLIVLDLLKQKEGNELSCSHPSTRLIKEDGLSEDFIGELQDMACVSIDNSGMKGWRQMGRLAYSIDESVQIITQLMSRYGFDKKYDVDDKDNKRRLLSQFESVGGQKVLWMFWPVNSSETGFSWGVSK